MAAMKGGVETGHLRNLRPQRLDRTNRRQVVRLMQRRQRNQPLQCREQRRVNPHRCGMVDAAMHHPVAHGQQRCIGQPPAQPAAQQPDRGLHLACLGRRQAALIGHLTGASAQPPSRLMADA